MRRTKIVATIGPAFDTKEGMKRMIEAGVDVVRFNMKHNTLEWHNERMELMEEACKEKDRRVAMLIDLQGPEVRIDEVPEKYRQVKSGDKVVFCSAGEDGISLDHPEIFKMVKDGGTIFADDGFLEFKILSKGERSMEAEVIEGGEIKPRKTVNFPGMHLDFPTLIEKDIKHLSLATKHHVDFVALSFVRSADDIKTLREELKKHDVRCKIIAKIEHPDAAIHFDEILDESDGVMVARGDLGIEFPMEEVPGLQKMMVRRCREEGKPVIIATQMLESMTENIRPTRAEVSDVANAAYDGADALMLSGETAMGKHPARVVKTMARIVEKVDHSAEKPILKIDWDHSGQTAAVVSSAYQLMKSGYHGACDLQAFVVLTETGKTVQYLSRLRPELPIYALSQKHITLDQLKLSWGITPVYCETYSKKEKIDERDVINHLKSLGYLEDGRQVIMIYGEVMGKPGLTSIVRLQEI